MLDLLKAVGSVLSPMSAGIGMVGDALGLPKEITSAIKTVAGVATGNLVMAADGVGGLMSELSKNPPAKTELSAPKDPALASEGYAKTTQSTPHQASQARQGASASSQASGGILDPIILEYRDALRQLSANFDLLEGTERAPLSSKNGKLDTQTLFNAANNPRLPQGLRDACRFFSEHPEYRNMLDTAGKGGKTDGTISTKDVQAALSKVNQDIEKFGVRREAPACASPSGTSSPPATSGTSSPPVTGGTSPSTPGSSASPLDPNFREYREVLGILDANFRTFDSSVGRLDEFLTRDNLRNISENPNASAQLKKVAEFFLAHPEYYDRLEMSAGLGNRDGVVGWGDVRAAITHADADIAKYGLPQTQGPRKPPSGPDASSSVGSTRGTSASSSTSASSDTSATSGTESSSASSGTSSKRSAGSSVRDILSNPNMSIEEKIQAILMSLAQSVDDELLQTMDDLAAAQDKRAGIESTPENQKALKDAERNIEMIELRLQNLMEKRKAMFDLMSNMSSKFNEMAKTAINNLRSA